MTPTRPVPRARSLLNVDVATWQLANAVGYPGLNSGCTTQVQEVRSLRYLFEEYAFDTARRELCRGPDVIPVTPQVFDLLAYLIRHRERVVT